MSTYDDVHDRYFAGYTAGGGKRYERLVALVMKILDSQHDVIHDRQLRGISDVEHQIDVIVDRNGERKRVLIECKDYDTSGNKVGLPEIRNFESACRDLGADEAYFVTCNGFTGPAQRYAKHYKIKLLVLRKFRDADWAGRIREIHINYNLFCPTDIRVVFTVPSQEDADIANQIVREEGVALPELIQLYNATITIDGTEQPFTEFLHSVINEVARLHEGEYRNEKQFEDAFIIMGEHPPIRIASLAVSFVMTHSSHRQVIASRRIAEFLLFGSNEDDLIIYEDDLQRFTINSETGLVALVREAQHGFLPATSSWT